MVIDEVYRILQSAFDNKLTIKEAITKLNVNVKYSTVITYKNKYNITEYDRHKIDKKDVLKIIEYSSKHCIPEKEAITSLGYNISNLSYYKRKFGIETHPYGNAPFTARMKRKYSVDDAFFKIPNLLNCYYAGFIAADGNINRERKLLSIGLSVKDENWLKTFQDEIRYNGKICQTIIRNKFKISCLAIRSQSICNDLLYNFNITPRKSLTLQPPKLEEEKLINSFICGYIDGDGSIIRYKNRHDYDTLKITLIGTLEMCSWIKRQLSKYVGDKGCIIHKPDSINNTYILSYSTKSARTIFEKLYSLDVPKLKRKWTDDIHNHCQAFKKHNPKGTSKGVYIFNLYGKLLKYCNTLKEAEEFTDVPFYRISVLCKKDNHYESNGYMFSRENKKEKYIPQNYFWLNREKELIKEGRIKEGDFPIIVK